MQPPPVDSILDLAAQRQKFADERDWVQFHTPKNLAMALSVEAAELAEPFTWLRPEDSDSLDAKQFAAVKQELGDVLIYTIMLASRLGIDPLEVAYEKCFPLEELGQCSTDRGVARRPFSTCSVSFATLLPRRKAPNFI